MIKQLRLIIAERLMNWALRILPEGENKERFAKGLLEYIYGPPAI